MTKIVKHEIALIPKKMKKNQREPKEVCGWFFKKRVDGKVKRERYINRH